MNAKKSRRKMVSKQIIFTLRRKKIYWAYARAFCRSFKKKIDSNGKDLSKQRRFSHTSCSAAIACFLSKPEAACWQNVRLTSPKLRFRTAVYITLFILFSFLNFPLLITNVPFLYKKNTLKYQILYY